jgi:putative transposase
VSVFCSLFGYTKQAYYKHRTGSETRQKQGMEVKHSVLQLRRHMPRVGTRKLHHLLHAHPDSDHLKIGRDRLFALLRQEGLLITKVRRYTVTTNSKHWMRKYPDQIKDLHIHRPEQVWVADITYLDTGGHSYLHLITDAYSKKVMGYELSDNMEAISTLKALKMAIADRQYPNLPLIHHSDRGLQYCSKIYVQYLKKNNIAISMTENGDPYENAIAERMNGILKDEFGLGERLGEIDEAIEQTAQSVQTYNEMRPHLSCQYLTPSQMHKQDKIPRKIWKKKISKATQITEIF